MNDTKKNIINNLRYLITVLLIAFILAKIITTHIAVIALIPSESMKDTLNINDKVLVNIIGTKFSDIKRGDIIVFRPPENTTDKEYYIKRVIGLPGDTVEITNGIVYINGNKLKEDYVLHNDNNDYGPYNVPENSYFVLGDNRTNSYDARFWINKYVDKGSIMGKAVIIINGNKHKIDKPNYDFQ